MSLSIALSSTYTRHGSIVLKILVQLTILRVFVFHLQNGVRQNLSEDFLMSVEPSQKHTTFVGHPVYDFAK